MVKNSVGEIESEKAELSFLGMCTVCASSYACYHIIMVSKLMCGKCAEERLCASSPHHAVYVERQYLSSYEEGMFLAICAIKALQSKYPVHCYVI